MQRYQRGFSWVDNMIIKVPPPPPTPPIRIGEVAYGMICFYIPIKETITIPVINMPYLGSNQTDNCSWTNLDSRTAKNWGEK